MTEAVYANDPQRRGWAKFLTATMFFLALMMASLLFFADRFYDIFAIVFTVIFLGGVALHFFWEAVRKAKICSNDKLD